MPHRSALSLGLNLQEILGRFFKRDLVSIGVAMLLCPSLVLGFQLQKSAVKIATPSQAHAPVSIKSSASRTPASSHIRYPRTSNVHAPLIRRFSFARQKNSIVRSHRESIGAESGSISVMLDLGRPIVSTSDGTVIDAPPGMQFSSVRWQGLANGLPPGFLLNHATGGTEEIPVLTVTFAVPADATDIVPVVSGEQTIPIGNIHFAPSLSYRNGVLRQIFDPVLYGRPLNVSAGNPITFRSLRSVTLSIPLVRRTANGEQAVEKCTIGIRFKTSGSARGTVVRDPFFASLDSLLVVNTWDLAPFGASLRPPKSPAKRSFSAQSATDTTVYGWIDPSVPYIRLAITRDGLYRVAASDLSFSNFSIGSAGWTPHTIRCINRGKEIPIWVDTDANGNIASIEFYGEHLRGFPLPTIFDPTFPEPRRAEYYNVATDTNVYWLTTSDRTGGTPLRFKLSAPNPAGAPVISIGTVLYHHERDLNYYLGDAGSDETETSQRTEYVGGERFEWYELHGTLDDSTRSHFVDTFYISQLPADTAGLVANVKCLLRGMTSGVQAGSIVYHLVTAHVNNGSSNFPTHFADYSYDSLTFSVPLSDLHVGANILHVDALTQGATVDQFYLDYYEVTFPSALVPSTDTAIAKGQWRFSLLPSSGTVQIGLSDPSAHLYNRSDTTRVLSQSGMFADAAKETTPAYVAATPTSFLHCDNIQPWNVTGSKGWSILSPRQVDYIIITHPNFAQAASRLAARRTSAGFQTMVATTDEIFNTFDFGSNEPVAIRRFLNYAYYDYSGTPVSFVSLLGNASWDPKKNLSTSSVRSYVPTYGNPVSDYYFTLPGEGDSNLTQPPLMMIARIPVDTESNADNYLSKLVEYEDEAPAEWDRRFLFIAGGQAGGQHEQFDQEIQGWLSDTSKGIARPPMNISPTIIDRTDYTSGVDATHVGDIEDALLRGQSLMYFAGHGATFTADVLFPDATVLHNKGLYPLLMTLSCRTGAFAEPDMIGVNQSYIQARDAGSVQAYGTTGFGETGFDDALTSELFQLMHSYDSTHDTTQPHTINMLQLLTASKIYAYPFAFGFQDVGLNGLLQNSMLGDAVTGFVLRPQPEFATFSSELHAYARNDTVARPTFSVSDSLLTIRAIVHNYGYSAERPVVVRIVDAGPNGLPFSRDDTLPRLDDSAFVSAQFPLTAQAIGPHTIRVIVDPDRRFAESYRLDDSASIQILVNGLSTTAFYPYEGARQFCDVSPGSTHFIVLTPAGTNPSDQVELELDTTERFSNILLDRKTAVGTSYDVTFDVPLPPAPVPFFSVYWWRTRIVRGNGDTTGWQYATFSIAPAARPEFSYAAPEQLASTIVSGLSLDIRGRLYLPQQDTMRIEAISHGLNDSTLGGSFSPYAQVLLNGYSLYEAGGNLFNGFVLLLWSADGSQIPTANEFNMPWTEIGNPAFEDSAAHIFDSLLAAVPQGERVTVLTIGSTDFQYFFDSTKAEMESIGSAQGMGPMSYDGSYAIVGTKGSAPGSARENFAANGSNGAHAFDTTVSFGTAGLAQTPFTAVARDYGALRWTGDPIPPGSDISFTVLGVRRDGAGVDQVTTFKASQGNSFDLSKIDVRTYDELAVRMNFSRSSNSSQSPALGAIELEYDPAPEFIFTTDSVQTVPAQTASGNPIIAHYSIGTLTCTPGDSVTVALYRQYQGKSDTPAVHVIPVVPGHGSQSFADTLQTTAELGPAQLTAVLNPYEAQNEQLLFNNTISGSYTVTRDTIAPLTEVLFTEPGQPVEQHIPDCGYVSSRSNITIDLVSQNPLRDTARSSISADFLNENNASEFFPVSTDNPHGYNVQFKTFSSGPLQAQLVIVPTIPFTAGQWLMHAYVRDASGNTDTLEQCFVVSDVNGLEHVMNYPNPFKDKTDFTFVLKSDAPADVKIVVYTIAGRKIRTLTPTELRAGLNMVEWDGRDERGNDVANGTYLYRVVLNGKNGDNTSQAVTERAVRSR